MIYMSLQNISRPGNHNSARVLSNRNRREQKVKIHRGALLLSSKPFVTVTTWKWLLKAVRLRVAREMLVAPEYPVATWKRAREVTAALLSSSEFRHQASVDYKVMRVVHRVLSNLQALSW